MKLSYMHPVSPPCNWTTQRGLFDFLGGSEVNWNHLWNELNGPCLLADRDEMRDLLQIVTRDESGGTVSVSWLIENTTSNSIRWRWDSKPWQKGSAGETATRQLTMCCRSVENPTHPGLKMPLWTLDSTVNGCYQLLGKLVAAHWSWGISTPYPISDVFLDEVKLPVAIAIASVAMQTIGDEYSAAVLIDRWLEKQS